MGNRLKSYTNKAFRPFHTLGNKLVRSLVNKLFKAQLTDIMSGFRMMSRSFVKNINIMSSGFEVETEMSIKALKYGYVIKEVDVLYKERPQGSYSKLNTLNDGILVLKTIFIIFKDYKPLFLLLRYFRSLAADFLTCRILCDCRVRGDTIYHSRTACHFCRWNNYVNDPIYYRHYSGFRQ